MSDEKFSISEEDKALFREAMRDVTPLKGAQSAQSTPSIPSASNSPAQSDPQLETKVAKQPAATRLSRRRSTIILNKAQTIMPKQTFSTAATVSSDTIISFHRAGLGHNEIRKLRQGKIKIAARLDLHQSTVEQALQQCQQFLEQCQNHGIRFALLIHGKSAQTGQPILKNVLNRWLRDHPAILAFHTAKPYHGGGGALYIVIRTLNGVSPDHENI